MTPGDILSAEVPDEYGNHDEPAWLWMRSRHTARYERPVFSPVWLRSMREAGYINGSASPKLARRVSCSLCRFANVLICGNSLANDVVSFALEGKGEIHFDLYAWSRSTSKPRMDAG
jgi:hypothetical protein